MNATELLEHILATVPAESPETGRVVNVDLRNQLFRLQTLVSGLAEEREAAAKRADAADAMASARLNRLERLEQSVVDVIEDDDWWIDDVYAEVEGAPERPVIIPSSSIKALTEKVRQRIAARGGTEDGDDS